MVAENSELEDYSEKFCKFRKISPHRWLISVIVKRSSARSFENVSINFDSRFEKGFEIREAMEQMADDIRLRSGILRSAGSMLVDLRTRTLEYFSFESRRENVDSLKYFIDSRRETGMAVDQAVDPRRRVTS